VPFLAYLGSGHLSVPAAGNEVLSQIPSDLSVPPSIYLSVYLSRSAPTALPQVLLCHKVHCSDQLLLQAPNIDVCLGRLQGIVPACSRTEPNSMGKKDKSHVLMTPHTVSWRWSVWMDMPYFSDIHTRLAGKVGKAGPARTGQDSKP
jgi:hypothetical protein